MRLKKRPGRLSLKCLEAALFRLHRLAHGHRDERLEAVRPREDLRPGQGLAEARAPSKIHESPLGALQGAQIPCAVQKLYSFGRLARRPKGYLSY